jgi:hypothetical protein
MKKRSVGTRLGSEGASVGDTQPRPARGESYGIRADEVEPSKEVREAIRQLCASLDSSGNRKAVIGGPIRAGSF